MDKKMRWKSVYLSLFLMLGQVSEGALPYRHSVSVRIGEKDYALSCPIADADFHSVLWILHEENVLIGASANYDHLKYRYLPSTGQLLIKEVEFSDSGLYRCIVKFGTSASGTALKQEASAVELIVKRSYTNLWEEEFRENTVRGGVAAGLVFSVVMALCLVYKCRHKNRSYRNFDVTQHQGQLNLGLTLEPESTSSTITNKGVVKPLGQQSISQQQIEENEEVSAKEERVVRGEILIQPELKDLSRSSSRKNSTSSSFLRKLSLSLTGNTIQGQLSSSNANINNTEPVIFQRVNSLAPVAPIASSESSSSVVSVGVNTDPTPSDRITAERAGSTIIYVTSE